MFVEDSADAFDECSADVFAGAGIPNLGGSLFAEHLACSAQEAAQELDPRGIDLFS